MKITPEMIMLVRKVMLSEENKMFNDKDCIQIIQYAEQNWIEDNGQQEYESALAKGALG